MSGKVVLIDGKNFGFRNAYAHISLRNSKGFPTGMFHGGLSSILKLVKLFPDAAIVFCWDGLGKTWRHQTPPFLYKANRQKDGEMPPNVKDAFSQFKTFANVVHNTLKFKYLRFDHIEADDVIGLATTVLKEDRDVVIVSSDMDFYQLVDDHVSIFHADKLFTPKKVYEEFGVATKDWLNYRALTGDSSDNLPGAPGIGPVNARKLLELGAKPGVPWAAQKTEVRKKYPKLEEAWNTVMYCWRMSRIATGSADLAGCVGSDCIENVVEALTKIVSDPHRGKYEQSNYEEFVKFLGEYELEYHIKLRNVWWKIK